MPNYAFTCKCKCLFGKHIRDNEELAAVCPLCGEVVTNSLSMARQPVQSHARSFQTAAVEYACPITGKYINSKHGHEDNLKQHDCRVLEAGEAQNTQSRREAEDAALDKKIEDTVEKTIESYSSAQKEQLHNELVNGGLDISVDRK